MEDAISKAELWVTTDNSASWQFFGNDADLQSPMLVNVDADGIYGFRMVIQRLHNECAPHRCTVLTIYKTFHLQKQTFHCTFSRFYLLEVQHRPR